MSADSHEANKLNDDLKKGSIITIHAAYKTWESKDGRRIGYTLVIEDMGQLSKVKSYDESLAKQQSFVPVEFYRNSQFERCVRRSR